MGFNVEIANISVGVIHRYKYIEDLCRDYITDKPAAFTVSVTEKEIEEEVRQTKGYHSYEACESTCLHRAIVNRLVKYGVILMHSAVVAVDGDAYVFMAKSGVGKSTHISMWKELFGERAVIVNGDKPMFSFSEDGVLMVHGSPWRGKEGYGEPISRPVKAICMLERGFGNIIEPIGDSDIVGGIFNQVLLPTNAEDMTDFMGIIDRIIKEIPFYRLRCNKSKGAALVAYEGMKGATK